MDNQVWEAAPACGLNIPDGYYFLVDAGYPEDPWLLLPYCGIWYHLTEWNQASQKYVTVQTSGTWYWPFLQDTQQGRILNLWHASAQNVIKHIFGVLKCKFCILWMAPEYEMSLQAWIPVVLATVHNFIWEHELVEEDEPDDLQPIGGGVDDDDEVEVERNDGLDQCDNRRNWIAEDMWAQYVDEHLHHRIPLPDVENQYNKYIFSMRQHYNMTAYNTNNTPLIHKH